MDRIFVMGSSADDEPFILTDEDVSVHGVVFGASGSGKTGFLTVLMEEALLNGIDVVALDVKGDLSNLGLGITDTISDSSRLESFRKNAKISIYTPGSLKGRPVSILSCLKPLDAQEDLWSAASSVANSLLPLAGMSGEKLQNEARLLTELFVHAWKNRIDILPEDLPRMFLDPPFDAIGGVDVELLVPKKRRQEIAITLSTVFNSPNFKRWINGTPSDFDHFLEEANASIFYLAHLDSNERMMFISLLLRTLHSWMLRKGGSDKLKLLLVFDEVYGYLPPYPRDPPSKAPLLSLIKQGRSFGISVFLSTQNPFDIDYRALGNARLWVIGRLQTANDRKRALEGIVEAGISIGERKELNREISSLKPREFIVYNARNGVMRKMHTRQSFSSLRGPLSLDQIAEISGFQQIKGRISDDQSLLDIPPSLPEGVESCYLPAVYDSAILKGFNVLGDISLYYEPFLLLEAKARLEKPANGEIKFLRLMPASSMQMDLVFSEEIEPEIRSEQLKDCPLGEKPSLGFKFRPINRALRTRAGIKRVLDGLRNNAAEINVRVYRCEETGECSLPGEDLISFKERQQMKLMERQKKEIEELDRKLMKISITLSKEVEELRELERSLEELKTSIFVDNLIKLMKGRVRQTFRGVRGSYKKIKEIERRISLKKQRIARIELEKANLEGLIRRARAPPTILELTLRPKEVHVSSVMLVWVPIAEARALVGNRMMLVKANCFNGAVSTF
jgi:hypothetical protein